MSNQTDGDALGPAGPQPNYVAIIRKLTDKFGQDGAFKAAVLKKLRLWADFTEQASPALPPPHCDIAVVGMHCRFPPGTNSAEEFFEALLNKEDHLSNLSQSRLHSWVTRELQSVKIGTISHAFDFDHEVFGISPREAEAMDPHHRLALESVWSCLQDAAYTVDEFARSKTGVFVAMYNQDFAHLSRDLAWEEESKIYLGTGNAHCLLPNRISYFFDLRGPSEIVDTACSSALVALHRAVQSIRADECDQAIVCGVSLLLDPERLSYLWRLGVLSRTGHCAVFDQDSSGQVLGEGVASVILKRRTKAVADGDHIYGLIKASGVNHRGRRSGGLTKPDVASQVALIDDVYRKAKLDPAHVSYIEAHGNGGIGDMTELLAFQQSFPPGTYVGTAKANIGCLEAAGGLAQLIKVLMAMDRGMMPATIRHARLPTHVSLQSNACFVLTDNMGIDALSRYSKIPFTAAIHAYGIGGVNAHLVVQHSDTRRRSRPPLVSPVPLLITGRDPAMAREFARLLEAALRRTNKLELVDFAYTLAVGRLHYQHRYCVLAPRTLQDATAGLQELLSNHQAKIVGGQGATRELGRDVRSWLGGNYIDWQAHFLDACRVSLPAAPFRKKSFELSATKPPADQLVVVRGQPITFVSLDAFLCDWLSRHCRIAPERIDMNTQLEQYGVDSVVLVDLCLFIERKLHVHLSPQSLGPHATITDIASLIRDHTRELAEAGIPTHDRLLLSRMPSSSLVDVPSLTSLPARDQLFREQRARLDQFLTSVDPVDSSPAIRPAADAITIYEDVHGSIWSFIDTGAGNLFDLSSLQQLLLIATWLRDTSDSDTTKLVYFSHIGPHFSLGGHRKYFLETLAAGDHDAIHQMGETYKQFLQVLLALPCLTVGVAYGSAQGGGMELLMAMDLQVVWPGVKLGFPEVKSSLIAGMGGISYLSSVVGPSRALQLNLSGALLSSEDALSLGLISHVSNDPFATALEFGEAKQEIASKIAVRRIVNRAKYPLLVADVEDWVSFLCGGELLGHEAKIRQDHEVIVRPRH
jgi:polyketide synthase PksN